MESYIVLGGVQTSSITGYEDEIVFSGEGTLSDGTKYRIATINVYKNGDTLPRSTVSVPVSSATSVYNRSSTYNRAEIDGMLGNINNTLSDIYGRFGNYYTKAETYNRGELYNRWEIDNLLSNLRNEMYGGFYTKAEVDEKVNNSGGYYSTSRDSYGNIETGYIVGFDTYEEWTYDYSTGNRYKKTTKSTIYREGSHKFYSSSLGRWLTEAEYKAYFGWDL